MLPKLPDFSLTLEQEFDLKKLQHLAQEVSKKDLEALFIQVVRLKMAQENIAKGLMKSMLDKSCQEQ